MKQKFLFIISIILFFIINSVQGTPTPSGGDDIPIGGGGIILLVAAAIGYGGKILFDNKKKNS